MKLIIVAISALIVAGCGGSGSQPASPSTQSVYSYVLQQNVTTDLKHIVFFNTSTGQIQGTAFVTPDVLAVPFPVNKYDAVVTDPIPFLGTATVSSTPNGYMVNVAATAAGTYTNITPGGNSGFTYTISNPIPAENRGPYLSALTRTHDASGTVERIRFSMNNSTFAVQTLSVSDLYGGAVGDGTLHNQVTLLDDGLRLSTPQVTADRNAGVPMVIDPKTGVISYSSTIH